MEKDEGKQIQRYDINRINDDADKAEKKERGRNQMRTDRNKDANDSLTLQRSKSRSKSPITRSKNPLEHEPERMKDLNYHKQKNQVLQVQFGQDQ